MILPSGVNKAKGLAAALKELQLSPHNVIAVAMPRPTTASLRMVGTGWPSPMRCGGQGTADNVTQGSRSAGSRVDRPTRFARLPICRDARISFPSGGPSGEVFHYAICGGGLIRAHRASANPRWPSRDGQFRARFPVLRLRSGGGRGTGNLVMVGGADAVPCERESSTPGKIANNVVRQLLGLKTRSGPIIRKLHAPTGKHARPHGRPHG